MKKILYGITLALISILVIPNTVLAAPTTTAESKEWNKIVTAMKNSEFIKSLNNAEQGASVSITDDAYSLKIVITDKGITNPITIEYTQSYGIVHYTSSNTTNDALVAMIEYLVHHTFLEIVATNYGYDTDEFFKWLDTVDETKLTVDNDGIAFTTYKATYKEDGEEDITVEPFKTLSINIDCNISAFDNYVPSTPEPEPEPTPEPTPEPEQPAETPDVEEKVENPNTGLYISLGVLVVAFAGTMTFIYSRKKNYFSKI